MLKTNNFTISRDLCKFINDNEIDRKDIQIIFVKEGAIYLIYWDLK